MMDVQKLEEEQKRKKDQYLDPGYQGGNGRVAG